MSEIVFGPVPSRRLGRSLGINHIPPKVCTYSCVYCQLGRTDHLRARRQAWFTTAEIVSAVGDHLRRTRGGEGPVDYLAFVPDGEPTLDVRLGDTIRALRGFGIPIAVITNGSLLHLPEVRDDLLEADWVSIKVDAVREASWRGMDRPHGGLALDRILEGAAAFAAVFQGDLQTETMIVAGVNDGDAELRATAEFVQELHPRVAYLSAPTRPPAEAWVRAPEAEVLTGAFEIFRERVPRVELLTGYEGDAFSSTGDPRRDLLSITAVHPMRESAVRRLLGENGVGWDVVSELIAWGDLVEVSYGAHRYFLRPLGR